MHGRPRPVRLALLSVLGFSGLLWGCGQPHGPLVIVTVSGLDGTVSSLRAGAALDGQPATEVKELNSSLDKFGMRLTEGSTGKFSLQIDALDKDRCVVKRGAQDLALSGGPEDPLLVPLTALTTRLCQCSTSNWCWENPVPQGNTLNGTFTLAPGDSWAVGDEGTLLHYDGAAWSSVASNTTAPLYAMWGDSPQDLWVVGARGTILHFDGTTWSQVHNRLTTRDLFAVWGFAGPDVWIAGDVGTLLHVTAPATLGLEDSGVKTRLSAIWGTSLDNLWAAGDNGAILRRTDSAWVPPTSGAPTQDLSALWGADDSQGVWAVGQGGTILHATMNGVVSETSNTALDLNGVWGSGPEDLWAAGGMPGTGAGVLLRRQNGTWSQLAVPSTDALNSLTSVSGSGPEDVWAVGAYGTILHAGATDLQSVGTGKTARTFQAIWGSGLDDVWAVGGHDDQPLHPTALAHFDGASWVTDTTTERRSGSLQAVWGTGPTDVWAVGNGGTILHFTGGPGWVTENTAALTGSNLNGVGGVHDGDVWVVGDGGTILHRVGGAWTLVPQDTQLDLNAVWVDAAPQGAGAQHPVWIGGADQQHHAVILQRQDSGFRQVMIMTSPAVQAMAGTGEDNIWALTEQSQVLHFDGKTWNQLDTGRTGWLAGLWVNGLGEAWTAGQGGTILHWNGQTWERLISGTTNDLNGLWGWGAYNLWAVGVGSSIMRQRL